jgi:RNA polymerase sigma factor (sigma-70 family)
VFLEAWSRRNKVRLSGSTSLPWLLGVANNVTRNSNRSVLRYRAALDRLPRDMPQDRVEEIAVARADADASLQPLIAALRTLHDVERDVVMLVLWSGLSYEEAAVSLDIPVGTVRSRLSRARSKLKESLALASTFTHKEQQ